MHHSANRTMGRAYTSARHIMVNFIPKFKSFDLTPASNMGHEFLHAQERYRATSCQLCQRDWWRFAGFPITTDRK